MTQVLTVDHKKLRKHLKIAAKAQQPVFIWGKPGIGKSMEVYELAKQLAGDKKIVKNGHPGKEEFGFVDIRLSMMEPTDLLGIPFKSEDNFTKYCPPDSMPRSGEGVLFLDELTLAPPSLQSAAYRIIHDREVGDQKIPDGWFIVAASNRSDDGANIFEMAKPLQNRFGQHLELSVPKVEDWVEWAEGNNIHPTVTSYLLWQQGDLMRFDPRNPIPSYPTPRSWENTSKQLWAVESMGTELPWQLACDIAQACVGEETGMKFGSYLKARTKINLDEIWKNPGKINEKLVDWGEDHEIQYTAVANIAEVACREIDVKNMNNNQKFAAAVTVATIIDDEELGAFLTTLMRTQLQRENFRKCMYEAKWQGKLVRTDWVKRYGKYMEVE